MCHQPFWLVRIITCIQCSMFKWIHESFFFQHICASGITFDPKFIVKPKMGMGNEHKTKTDVWQMDHKNIKHKTMYFDMLLLHMASNAVRCLLMPSDAYTKMNIYLYERYTQGYDLFMLLIFSWWEFVDVCVFLLMRSCFRRKTTIRE